MECPSCGATLRDNAVFCSSCGQRITAQTAQTRIPPRDDADAWGEEPPVAPPRGPAGGGAGGPGPGAPPFGARRTNPLGGTAAPGAGPDFNLVTSRLTRLLKLDTSVFQELKGNQAALIPSLVVAGVSIFLLALGGWLWWWFEVDFRNGRFLGRSVIGGTIFGLPLWVAWVWVSCTVLSSTFRRQANFRDLLPALGLATVPFVLGLLMLIDPLRITFGAGALVAGTALMQIALQETTDATPGEVFVANLVGFLLWVVVLGLLGGGDRDLAPGILSFQ